MDSLPKVSIITTSLQAIPQWTEPTKPSTDETSDLNMPSSTRIRLGITVVHGTQNVRYSIGPATTGAVSLQSRPTPHLRWLSFKFSLIQGHASDATGTSLERNASERQPGVHAPSRELSHVPCRASKEQQHQHATNQPSRLTISPNKLAPANHTNFTCGKSITPSWMVSDP